MEEELHDKNIIKGGNVIFLKNEITRQERSMERDQF